jgi:hypothetical protein
MPGPWSCTNLPPMTLAEGVEITRLHRVAGLTGRNVKLCQP